MQTRSGKRHCWSVVLVPLSMVAAYTLTLVNLPGFEENLEEPTAAAYHILHDPPPFNPLLLTVAPFEGLGQAGTALGIAAFARIWETYVATKLMALTVQIVVWVLWYVWAARILPLPAVFLGSVFFILPPDNYAGTMGMSNGHHAEALVIFLLVLLLLEYRRKNGRWFSVLALGILAGFGVSVYPVCLMLLPFLLIGCLGYWFSCVPCITRILLLVAGVVIGYLPLVSMHVALGLPPLAQLQAHDAWFNVFVQAAAVQWTERSVLMQMLPLEPLRQPGLPIRKALATISGIWVAVADRHTCIPVAGDTWYRILGLVAVVLALGFVMCSSLLAGKFPHYAWGYVVIMLGAYLLSGERFIVAADRPGEPGAYRYLLPIYPLLFAALGGAAWRLWRWCHSRIVQFGIIAIYLFFAAYPFLLRARYDAERFGQVAALCLGYPAVLGNSYFRAYGNRGITQALARLNRLAETEPETAELIARGFAVAVAVENSFPLMELAARNVPEGPVCAGWWQGLGFCYGGLWRNRLGIGNVSLPVLVGAKERQFWYGAGHAFGYDAADSASAMQLSECVPPTAHAAFWQGYGEAMVASIFRANVDMYRTALRLPSLPPEARVHAARGFRVGVLRIAKADAMWTRKFLRWLDSRLALACPVNVAWAAEAAAMEASVS